MQQRSMKCAFFLISIIITGHPSAATVPLKKYLKFDKVRIILLFCPNYILIIKYIK